jgi:hypothetical protein
MEDKYFWEGIRLGGFATVARLDFLGAKGLYIYLVITISLMEIKPLQARKEGCLPELIAACPESARSTASAAFPESARLTSQSARAIAPASAQVSLADFLGFGRRRCIFG